MNRTFSFLFIFLVFFGAACNKSQKSGSTAMTETIGDVEFIHNIETPLYPEKKVIFGKELSISIEDENGNIVLFNPRQFIVDHDEDIYIVEGTDQVIKVFNPEGKYIKAIGAKGSGPGEFQSIIYLGFSQNGNLAVIDIQARRTNLFDVSGQFIKSFQWQKSLSGAHLFKNNSYICQETLYGENRQERRIFIKEIDYDGNEIRSYGEFTPVQMKVFMQANSRVSMSIPHSRQSIFVGDQNREWLYHCLNDQYIIEVYDNSGILFRKIDRPYEPVPFTDEDKREYRQIYERSNNDLLKKLAKEMELPKVKSITRRMLVDDESYLWLQTSEQKKDGDKSLAAYDVFDPDGRYYARVWCEINPVLFCKRKMYRMETDTETGYRTLSRYKVIWQ